MTDDRTLITLVMNTSTGTWTSKFVTVDLNIIKSMQEWFFSSISVIWQ